MKAVVYSNYGPPEVLQLKEMARPVPRDNEVLIRIRATTVTAEDCTFRKGSPFIARLATGLARPKTAVPGSNLAGDIEAVGKQVTRFKPGDQVFAASDAAFGAHAGYLCLPEDAALALKPVNLTCAEAVSISSGGLTALPFLRDAGKIRRGQKILINGASGSVGTAAVQLASVFGAEATAVCSTGNLQLVKSLGAGRVIDYTKDDFAGSGETWDIIFDAVGKRSYLDCRRALKPGGIYLSTVLSLSILLHMLWTSMFGSKRAMITFTGLRPADAKSRDLTLLKDLAEQGELQPVIDRTYSLGEIVAAHRYVDKGHKKGNVVLTLAHADDS